jgi:hypothetical protein
MVVSGGVYATKLVVTKWSAQVAGGTKGVVNVRGAVAVDLEVCFETEDDVDGGVRLELDVIFLRVSLMQ